MPAPGRLRLDELIRQLPPEGDIQPPWERGVPRLGIPQLGIPIPRAEVRAPQGGGRQGGGGGHAYLSYLRYLRNDPFERRSR
jgi:hypothetical protein